MSGSTSSRRSVTGTGEVATEADRTPASPSVATPADGLLHPVALVALAILIVNDRLLKDAWPGPVTGKLSDVAGLVVAPLALQAGWEVLTWVAGRWTGPSRRVLAVAILLVGLGFVAIQVPGPSVDAYRVALGVLQWPFAAVGALASGRALPPITPVIATPDIADLLALPALGLAWLIGRGRSGRREPGDVGYLDS